MDQVKDNAIQYNTPVSHHVMSRHLLPLPPLSLTPSLPSYPPSVASPLVPLLL